MSRPKRIYFAPVPSRLIIAEYGECGDSYFTAPGVLSDLDIVEICLRYNAFPALLAAAKACLNNFGTIDELRAAIAAAEGGAP